MKFKFVSRTVTVMAALAVVLTAAPPAGAVSPPALKMTSGVLRNYEHISVSVGPNRYFRPYSHVNILECADPGGLKKNLPTSASTCDGNTIQGNVVLVNKNGSFSESGYELYILPNTSQLGEDADGEPACSPKKSCVLYIGEDQENFTWPKMFSHPFELQESGKRR